MVRLYIKNKREWKVFIMMKAMLVENERLVLREVEMPVAKADEVLIEVRAIGINRADLLQRSGKYPSPKGWPGLARA